MKNFEVPQFEVLTFAVEEIMTLSSVIDSTGNNDKPIELPDHEW